jgi:hypothetical protein
MVVESNVPLQVVGKRDRILRVVVEFYTTAQAVTTAPADMWGYQNRIIES